MPSRWLAEPHPNEVAAEQHWRACKVKDASKCPECRRHFWNTTPRALGRDPTPCVVG